MGIIEVPPIVKGPVTASGKGGGWGVINHDGPQLSVRDRSQEPGTTGVMVALAAIAMMFAAFTSAMFVRESSGNDWLHIDLPWMIYFNTFVLIVSSVTLEIARKKVASFVRGLTEKSQAMRWMYITLALGLGFVAGQFVVWQNLKAQGIYLSTNPTSSFFYVLTVFHAIHVLGGLGGLVRVVAIFRRPVLALRRSTMAATSYYWHFMGILWIYLLVIIITRM